MGAKIIVVTNQKGGCGKTTLTMNLAGVLGSKKKTLIIDGDSQGSATRWASSASDNKPFPTAIMGLANTGDKVHREIKKYAADYDYIFVDCPPAIDNNFTASALLVADLALVPVIPSPTDLWAAIGIQKVISNVMDLNENLQARLVANMCQNNTSISKEALTLIEEFEFPKVTTDIYQRTAYRQAAAFGGTVADLDNIKAHDEINQLISEILKLLNKRTKKN
ncbi:MAG: cobyrinic acid a,c-diamide synthase [Burkholderiales bacterium]|nr:cobyrinic acid a,c-diamide synthase [Burkholderiales bacterium]